MQLTQSQRNAVEATETDILCIAGAGAGKTLVLTERIAHMVEERGVGIGEIMVLTFTRKAAGELIERLSVRLNTSVESIRDAMLIGTFHSVALRILLQYGDRLGYMTDKITIITPDDTEMLVKRTIGDLGFKGTNPKRVADHLNAIYNGTWKLADPVHHETQRVTDEYFTVLGSMNCLDFGLILLDCSTLLRFHGDVLDELQDRIKHVLVDELQDSDAVQYNLHDFFAPPATFFGVGDTRQTIYKFRGARPDLMIERHSDARIIHLRDCFRCGEKIVQAANALIDHNHEPHALPMVEFPAGRVDAVSVFNGRSGDVAKRVKALVEYGHKPEDIAVLARTHKTLARIDTLIRELGVKVHRVGATFDVCKTDAFKLMHAALRLVVNPRDDLAFLWLAPAMQISACGVANIRITAAQIGTSMLGAAAAKGLDHSMLSKRLAEDFTKGADTKIDVALGLLGGSLGQSMIGPIKFWGSWCFGMSVGQSLRWYATLDSQDDANTEDAVTLSTIHAAKGLEWPVVLVVGLNEGGMPSSQSLKQEGGIQDERRVCYVAMTRAKDRLLLHYRKPCDQAKGRKASLVSRFVGEALPAREPVDVMA